MKTKKTLFGIIAMTTMMASCLSDDGTYTAAFAVENPNNGYNMYFANNVSDSLIFYGYGNWEIQDISGCDNSWLSIPIRNGKGYTLYSQLISFEQNTTGESRMGGINIEDISHPGEARATLAFVQYATRGDGSFGSAADVKSIAGSDGSNITLEYDLQHRPTLVKIQKEEQTLSQLNITYGDSLMTIKDGNSKTYTAEIDKDYQPYVLYASTDTIGYSARYYNATAVPFNYMFNVEHRGTAGYSGITYEFPYPKYSLAPDSIHNADTIYYYTSGKLADKLGVSYSQLDNRYQSVDANQLLLGVEKCDPYLLASLFRYARNSNVIAEAKNDEEQLIVSATLNSNKSISQMTVKRGSETITYTFNY